MRTAYHEQLAELTAQLGEMCRLAGVAMKPTTHALLQADLVLAEQVISDHEKISAMSARAEQSRRSSARSKALPMSNGWVRWQLTSRRSSGAAIHNTLCRKEQAIAFIALGDPGANIQRFGGQFYDCRLVWPPGCGTRPGECERRLLRR
jgi:uncharacterized membrane-anchored protein